MRSSFLALAPGTTQLALTIFSIRDLDGTIQEFSSLYADNQTAHFEGEPVNTGSLTGTVIDAQTGDPIEGAQVNISGPAEASKLTDSQGVYGFSSLPLGTYAVYVSQEGYISNSRPVAICHR